jgi:Ser/Thr protein kinase RdoA (MazF antagonist)
MDRISKDLFNSKCILLQIAQKLNLKEDNFRLINDVANFVYSFEKNGKSYILRVTHSSRRTIKQIEGELDWVQYLADRNVSICNAVNFGNGNIVGKIESEDSYFSYVVFDKIEGRSTTIQEWNSDLCRRWGKVMGKIHKLSKDYTPRDNSIKRPEWYEEAHLNTERFLPPEDIGVLKKFRNLIKHIYTFSRYRDNYGLLHGDLHLENFFLNNGEITVFDFDNAIYSWFLFDILIVLFDVQYMHGQKDVTWIIRRFAKHFLEGYKGENELEDNWREKASYFLKLHEIHIYSAIFRNFDINNLTGLEKEFMEGRRMHIETDRPYIDISICE